MWTSKNYHLLHVLLIINHVFTTSSGQQTAISFCGKIKIQEPMKPFLLSHMIICKSQKLYFRTSHGLIPVSDLDYKNKQLTISHNSCSSSIHFVSPLDLSAGFIPPPQPNSLILFSCLNFQHHMPPFKLIHNCTGLHSCRAALSQADDQQPDGSHSCLLVDDIGKLDKGFHPKDLNCSHYSRVYRTKSGDNNIKEFKLGTRIALDIPDHVPNPCDQCKKPHGNCGVGLRCVCHPKECKDKVFSGSTTINPFGNVLFCMISFSVFLVFLKVDVYGL